MLIEHYGGAFPAWLAPIQAVVAPISEHQADYGAEIAARLRAEGFRTEFDASNEKIGYKIRHWKMQKVPYVIVVGKSEAAEGTVNVNERGVAGTAHREHRRLREGAARTHHPKALTLLREYRLIGKSLA